ncbi:competence protein [Bacillus timonensis]|uniref:Competence protein n=1 Tax=Bacillus timonensis TaxID=1033734 RepID=A0A4S3PLA7_9BACI|nr:competence protein ComK [Bacillus timonensis]THE09924.1 competence protein [Bacillus timonensis]
MNQIQSYYEITHQTMAIQSVAEIEYSAIVREEDKTILVRQTPLQIIKAACLEGGASYEGRRKAVTHLTGAMQKVPIPINPRRKIFAFPTHSPTTFECNWIFFHHIKSIDLPKVPSSTIQSLIHFKNNQSLSMNESYYVLQKQYQRTAMCILNYSTPEQLQTHSLLGL